MAATPHADAKRAPRFVFHNVKEPRAMSGHRRRPESALAGEAWEGRHLGDNHDLRHRTGYGVTRFVAACMTRPMNDGISIAGIPIAGRVLLAPMSGVSDLPFRRAASRLGAAYG